MISQLGSTSRDFYKDSLPFLFEYSTIRCLKYLPFSDVSFHSTKAVWHSNRSWSIWSKYYIIISKLRTILSATAICRIWASYDRLALIRLRLYMHCNNFRRITTDGRLLALMLKLYVRSSRAPEITAAADECTLQKFNVTFILLLFCCRPIFTQPHHTFTFLIGFKRNSRGSLEG